MVNQAAIADFTDLAQQAGVDPVALVEGLKLGSATSAALTLLNTMVTPSTVEHLSEVEALDMELFAQAMADAGVEAGDTVARGLLGAHRLPELIARLNPMSEHLGAPAESADAEAVLQLVLRERQSRDRGWWTEMAACFASNATIDMSWFTGSADEFIRQTKERSLDGVWGRHRLSPPAVRLNGSRAWAELPLAIEFPVTVGGVEADLLSYCRSQYRAERVNGAWRLTRITSIYERDTLTPSVPGSRLPTDPNAFQDYRTSYRCLTWYFEQRGTRLRDDLLGDDRPRPVAEHYAAERAWLDLGTA